MWPERPNTVHWADATDRGGMRRDVTISSSSEAPIMADFHWIAAGSAVVSTWRRRGGFRRSEASGHGPHTGAHIERNIYETVHSYI
mmetsp:Transcript_47562/g.71959  ORF Transcript_47562/g.71959 Transcript_47562/m.71959 type:complete len:86 (-) Transcript_47562:78-335(-)